MNKSLEHPKKGVRFLFKLLSKGVFYGKGSIFNTRRS